MVAVAVAGVAAWRGAIVPVLEPDDTPVTITREHNTAAYRIDRCFLAQGRVDFLPECDAPGSRDAGRASIALWGDSHAAHLYPGLASVASDSGLTLAQYNMSDCAPLAAHTIEACQGFAPVVLARLRASRPAIVVLAARWHPEHFDRLPATIDTLRRLGVERVVVVGPVPRWNGILPRLLLRSRRSSGAGQGTHRMRFGADSTPMGLEDGLRPVVARTSATYVSALELFCQADGCLATLDGVPTAWDAAHLTEPASRLLARRIFDIVLRQ
jgi:hypothetical protein